MVFVKIDFGHVCLRHSPEYKRQSIKSAWKLESILEIAPVHRDLCPSAFTLSFALRMVPPLVSALTTAIGAPCPLLGHIPRFGDRDSHPKCTFPCGSMHFITCLGFVVERALRRVNDALHPQVH